MTQEAFERPKSGRFATLVQGRPTAFWMTTALAALVVIFAVITPSGTFLQVSNFQSMGRDAAIGVLLAMGMTVALGAGLLDLSIGANLVLSSVIGAQVLEAVAGGTDVHGFALTRAIIVGAIVSVLVGAVFGFINGLLVTRARVNSFITTLATSGIAAGLVLVLSGGADVPGLPTDLQQSFGVVNFAGIPITVWIIAPIIAVLWIAMRRTRFGIKTLSIGSARDAAVRAGIKVDRQILAIFTLVGALAGAAGFLDITRFGSTNILGHTTDSLAAIAAAVIGGTSLFGGVASVGGSITGALIPVVLGTGLVIYGLPSYYQQIVVGAILLLAVYLDQRRREQTV